eukprot:334078_1
MSGNSFMEVHDIIHLQQQTQEINSGSLKLILETITKYKHHRDIRQTKLQKDVLSRVQLSNDEQTQSLIDIFEKEKHDQNTMFNMLLSEIKSHFDTIQSKHVEVQNEWFDEQDEVSDTDNDNDNNNDNYNVDNYNNNDDTNSLIQQMTQMVLEGNNQIQDDQKVSGFECNRCHKRFKHISILKAHHQVHEKEKLYACRICKEKFQTQCALQIHQDSHNVDKPFQCKSCAVRFRHKNKLDIHVNTMHKNM